MPHSDFDVVTGPSMAQRSPFTAAAEGRPQPLTLRRSRGREGRGPAEKSASMPRGPAPAGGRGGPEKHQ